MNTTVLAALLALLACALAGCGSTRASVSSDPAFETELVALARAGIGTKEPNTSRVLTRGEPTLFDGNYDWHSCVIAHWMLLVSARVRGDRELESWLAGRLTPEALRHESDLVLAGDPFARPTWPYDEAWFCVLLSELDRRDPGRFGDLRSRHERHLVHALFSLPFPDGTTLLSDPRDLAEGEEPRARDLGGTYCGFYRSWTMAWLALAWADPVDADVRELHRRLYEERLRPELATMSAVTEGHGYDFLWIPALAALAAEAAGDARTYPVPVFEDLPASVTIPTVHVVGAHLTKTWPLRGDAAARALRDDVLRAFRERRDLWAEDFPACSHWVPQYLFVGEWLAAGRP
ncbi:MAG: DUF2891 family protein [Planctomycetota bacterium]